MSGELLSNAKRAKWAYTFIWVVFLLDIVGLFSSYFERELLNDVVNQVAVSMERAEASDLRQKIIGYTQFGIQLVSGILFIMWFRRAYFNLHLRVMYLKHTEGWAAAAWFVPIVNLYYPYQIMKELFHKTQEYLDEKGMSYPKSRDEFIVLWWVMWLISNVVGRFLFKQARAAETLDELLNTNLLSMISDGFSMLLALVTFKVVSDAMLLEQLYHQVPPENGNLNMELSETNVSN